MEHTKLPWYTRGGGKFPLFIEAEGNYGIPNESGIRMAYRLDVLGDDYTGHGGENQREANVKFILHACNNIERVEAVNAELLAASDMVSSKITDAGRRQVIHAGQLGVYLTLEEIDQLRAAITKAKETK